MIVVDASVAVKWFVAEPLHEQARRLLDADLPLLAPDLLPVEVADVVWKKRRRGELTTQEGQRLVAALLGGTPRLSPTAALLGDALDLAERLDHPVYDCVYLALAVREDARLVTADRRFHEAVIATDSGAGEGRSLWLGDRFPS